MALLTTAFALFAGLMMTRLFKVLHLNFPDVTAYLMAGLFVGPFLLGHLGISGVGFQSLAEVDALQTVNNAALGFIAFSIGSEFKFENLKHTGKAAVLTAILEGCGGAFAVMGAMAVIHFIVGDEIMPWSVVITIGAIASATAPAATLMVVRQYKADGPVTRMLLPIVALDDAVCLILFAIFFGIAEGMVGGSLSVYTIVINPLIEIVASVVLGALMGWILTKLERLFYSNSNRLALTISIVLFTMAQSARSLDLGPVKLSFSSLLVLMTMGMIFCNYSSYSEDIFKRANSWTVPLYACFFVLSGAALDLSVLAKPIVVVIGLVYIVIRVLGKILGAAAGTSIMKCEPTVRKYLGITLMPQAGVALGMATAAKDLGTGEGALIRNVVLFSVLIYEMVGPSVTRATLAKAGEISAIPASKKNNTRFANS